MVIEEALKIEFESVTGLSGKVHPLQAKQGTSTPYVVYELIQAERIMTVTAGFDGLINKDFQIDVYHTTYSALKSLMNSVIAKIKTFNLRNLGNEIYCQQVEILNEFEVYEDEVNLYKGVIEIKIFYRE